MTLALASLARLTGRFGLIALMGCGEVHDAMAPDAGPDGGPDTSAPRVVSVTPADHATRVSLLAPISIVFDEPLDPATIDATKIQLQARVLAWNGDVSYDDASRTVTFTPERPLLVSGNYRLEIGAFADLAGNTSEPSTTTFSTSVNATTRVTYYAAGAITSRWDYLLDANGNWSENIYFVHPGPDGSWETPDDAIDARIGYVYRADTVIQERRGYSGPGLDQTWLTPDDPVRDLTRWTADAEGRIQGHASAVAPGLDGMWGTADDALSRHVVNEWQGDRHVALTTYEEPGADALWLTPDDVITGYTTRQFDDDGNEARVTTFGDRGADGAWKTADDVPSSYSASAYDAHGHLVRKVQYSGPGTDAQWFTADDRVTSWESAVTTPEGLTTHRTELRGAGADAEWFTADDGPATLRTYQFDDRGLMIVTGNFSAGTDDQIGTSDDVQTFRGTFTYDAHGNRVESASHDNPGPDNTWGTADDRRTSRSLFDGAH